MARAATPRGVDHTAPAPAGDYLTIAETCSVSRHGSRTVRRWLADGRLPFIRVPGGQKILIRRTDLDDFLNGGRVDPGQPPRSSRA